MYELLVVLHVLGAAVWVGGVIALTFVAVPVATRLEGPPRAEALRAFGRRWRPLGWGALALAILTGLPLAARYDAYDAEVLLETTFGRLLTAKSALVVALLVFTVAHAWLGPRLARQLREGRPPTLRRPLVLVGRASLVATLTIPILGVLLTR